MRTVKKLVSFVLAGVMALAMSVSVFAATTGISTDEQRILDEAKIKATELGVKETSEMYQKYMSEASTYLAKNELSKAQVDAMVKAIDDAAATAKSYMKSKGVSRLGQLSSKDFNELFDQVGEKIVAAAKAVGIVVKKTADGYEVEDLVPAGQDDKGNNDNKDNKDNKGNTPGDNRTPDIYMQTGSTIKQTGPELVVAQAELPAAPTEIAADMTPAVIWGVILVGVVAVCGVVAKKKELFSGTEEV